MRHSATAILLLIFSASAFAGNGFEYNQFVNSDRRLPMRTISENQRTFSLDGEWQFKFRSADTGMSEEFDAPEGVWAAIDVPSCWECRGWSYPIYTNSKYPFPSNPPFISRDNPVGYYRRTFTLPEGWLGGDGRVLINFAGVYSGYYFRINGEYAGYAEDSALESEFDITRLLHEGENVVEVKVYRWTDGSYVEDADHWRLSGIYRSVKLVYESNAGVMDFRVRTSFGDDDYSRARLSIRPRLFPGADCGGCTVKAELRYGDDVVASAEIPASKVVKERYDQRHKPQFELLGMDVEAPALWTAETPELYTVEVSLVGADGNVLDSKSSKVGFRDIRIDNGRLLVNGRSVKLMGVNRHDHNEFNGKSVSSRDILKDLMQMKRCNINAVRTSHYPNAPEFYRLCDSLGFYVICEANVEAHNNGGELNNDQSWAGVFLERASRMAVRFYNHPSIIFWSVGNESGSGPAHAAEYAWLKEYDPARPVHNENAQDYSGDDYWFTDVVSRMYPSVDDLREMADGGVFSRPILMCEYAHSMGNSTGGLGDYWRLIRSRGNLIGGFIWDWMDQGLRAEVNTSSALVESGWLYGGDFGSNENHDANFCINGIVNPDCSLKPGAYEVKHVYQPLGMEYENGMLRIVNRNSFISTSCYSFSWNTVSSEGKESRRKVLSVPEIGPGESSEIDMSAIGGDYLNISYSRDGENVGSYQFALKEFSGRNFTGKNVCPEGNGGKYSLKSAKAAAVIENGRLVSFVRGGKELVVSPFGPCFTRAYTDNEDSGWYKAKRYPYFRQGENIWTDCVMSVEGDAVVCTLRAGENLTLTLSYRMNAAGELLLGYSANLSESCEEPLRIGMYGILTGNGNLEFLGLGPVENYPDRLESARYGLYSGSVENFQWEYIYPQENGNHCGARRLILGGGLRFESVDAPFCFSVNDAAREDINAARHTCEVKRLPKGQCAVHIDGFVTGVGGTDSWSRKAAPSAQYRLTEKDYRWSVILR